MHLLMINQHNAAKNKHRIQFVAKENNGDNMFSMNKLTETETKMTELLNNKI